MKPISILLSGLLCSDSLTHLAEEILAETNLLLTYIEVIEFGKIEHMYGDQTASYLLNTLHHALEEHANTVAGASVHYVWDDGFVLVAPLPIDTDISVAVMTCIDNAERDLDAAKPPFVLQDMRLRFGRLVLERRECPRGTDLPPILVDRLTKAAHIARRSFGTVSPHQLTELYGIIANRAITPHYQPIQSLRTGRRLGFEALSRGPRESSLHSPDKLFATAERAGELFSLEQVCREQALRAAPLQANETLFLNVHPQTLNDPSFVRGRTKQFAEGRGLRTSQIAFEITEHQSIEDYVTFRKTITHYREQGFRVAIDDTGSGYSGLRTLLELTPDFIKLDRSLVQDISTNDAKKAVVEAMATIADKIGAHTIAEGIETEDDLSTLRQLGVEFGQGFLLGKPEPFPLPVA